MVNISAQGQEIIKLCQLKLELQNRAEDLSDEAKDLIRRIKSISDEQSTILQNMCDVDRKIEYLAQKV